MGLAIGIVSFVVTVLAVTTGCRRWRLNPPLTLLIVGLLGSYLPFVNAPDLSPELVLVGLLPPLLYSAAVDTSLIDFRRNIAAIGWLSVGLVIFTALGVGVVVHAVLPVSWAAAIALGAVVAPPDAVAATSVARSVGMPRRVVTVLEGESLVNDATALVSLRTAIAAIGASVAVFPVVLEFVLAVVIALVIGALIAKVYLWVVGRLDDWLTITVVSLLAPFVAYLPAEALNASGVLAVVVAGLIIGHGTPRVLTGQTRLGASINWRTVQFLLENSVFLLIGLQTRDILQGINNDSISMPVLAAASGATLAAVILLRLVWIFATRAMILVGGTRLGDWRESMLIGWAGMRGVVTLAAALTLPYRTPHRPALIVVALAVTVGTLLLQGWTLAWLARRLGVQGPDPREDTLQEASVYRSAVNAGLAAAERAAGQGDAAALRLLRKRGDARVNNIWERLGTTETEAETPSQTMRRLRTVALRAERDEVLRLRDNAMVEHDVLSAVLAALDLEESALQRYSSRAEWTRAAPIRPSNIQAGCPHLAAAVDSVQPLTPQGCPDCIEQGITPVHLRLCLTCGHVGCCDSSVGQHATRHFEQAGHPVMQSMEPGETWRWCYIHQLDGG